METVEAIKQDTVTLSAHTFADLITGVSVATSADRTLPKFRNIYLSARDGELIAAATDRFRLIDGRTSLESGTLEPSAIELGDVKRILAAIKPYIAKNWTQQIITLTLARVGDILSLSIGGDSVTVRLSDEKLPEYAHIISDEFSPLPNIALNMKLLASFDKVPHDEKQPTVLGFTGENKAVQIRLAHNSIKWRAALMPMRTA